MADHRTRRWSSYLQIGVESFSDRELTRLGKGYLREHVRAIVADLSRRTLHHDAYFILSNHLTSFDDLVEVLDEVVRLKHLFPLYFHIRFPVVARLVSYATSAQHRRILRAGQTRALALRGELREPHHPELDYPLVDHDEPSDPVVRQFVDEGLFTDEELYAGTFRRLWQRLTERWRESRDLDEEFAARTVDDRQRRRVFELLDAARRAEHRDGDARSSVLASPALRATLRGQEARMMQVAEQALGPAESWLPAFGRFTMGGVTRLVVIPTWQCELRCNYCYIPKQDGRVMTEATVRRAINLLLSSERRELTLQFFGGEALLEWDLVRGAMEWGTEQAQRRGKVLDFVLSSNGWSLNEEKLSFLKAYPVKLELSLDGAPETQRRFRPAARAGVDSYEFGIAPRAAAILASGLRYDVIMVVHPEHIGRLAANYLHIVELGFERVQINFALGKTWSGTHRVELANQLFALSKVLKERPNVSFVNAENAPMPMRLNAEPTVDWDGTVYGGNAFLHETEHKARFRLGHLDDLHAFDRYWMDAPPNRDLVAWSYPKAVTENNLKVGAVMSDFVRWWRSELGLG